MVGLPLGAWTLAHGCRSSPVFAPCVCSCVTLGVVSVTVGVSVRVSRGGHATRYPRPALDICAPGALLCHLIEYRLYWTR